jgi:integrase
MREFQESSLGSIRKHPCGRWQGIIRYHEKIPNKTDAKGNPVYGPWKMLTKLFDIKCYGGKDNTRGSKNAEKALKAWREEVERAEPERAHNEELEAAGKLTPASTVSQFVDSYLLAQQKRVEKSTMNGYRRAARLIEDGLGDEPLKGLTADLIELWMDEQGKHYAPVTVNIAFRLLKASIQHAMYSHIIEYNPADQVKPLKQRRHEPNYLPPQERVRLLDDLNAKDPHVRRSDAAVLGIKLALFTGMREGEICGLRWRDVDFRGQFIRVRNAIGRDGEGTYEKTAKTDGSRRDIPLPKPLADELAGLKKKCASKRSEGGLTDSPNDCFVLGDPMTGEYYSPRVLWRAWSRRVKRLGLVGSQGKPPTFHDLRHTFATTAIAEGADVKSVASILGHADASMTLNIYTSADPEAKRRTMESVFKTMEGGADAARVIPFDKTGTDGR